MHMTSWKAPWMNAAIALLWPKRATHDQAIARDCDTVALDDYYQAAQALGISQRRAEVILNQTRQRARKTSSLTFSDVIFRAYCTLHLHPAP